MKGLFWSLLSLTGFTLVVVAFVLEWTGHGDQTHLWRDGFMLVFIGLVQRIIKLEDQTKLIPRMDETIVGLMAALASLYRKTGHKPDNHTPPLNKDKK